MRVSCCAPAGRDHPPRGQIDLDLAAVQAERGAADGCSSKYSLHASNQLVRIEWLGDVILGVELEGAHLRFGRVDG